MRLHGVGEWLWFVLVCVACVERIQARHKSQRIRSMRSEKLETHTRHKASLWKSVKNMSRSLQRGFHATHNHRATGAENLHGVDREKFEVRKNQAELARRRRKELRDEERQLRVLKNAAAIAQERLQVSE